MVFISVYLLVFILIKAHWVSWMCRLWLSSNMRCLRLLFLRIFFYFLLELLRCTQWCTLYPHILWHCSGFSIIFSLSFRLHKLYWDIFRNANSVFWLLNLLFLEIFLNFSYFHFWTPKFPFKFHPFVDFYICKYTYTYMYICMYIYIIYI
jgi:hypothetical protein